MPARRALIVGHFSTVGDVESVEIVKAWCGRAGLPFDVAPYSKSLREKIDGAIAPHRADPARYSHLLVVCGPCYPQLFRKKRFRIERYAHCHKIGVNLTMVAPLSDWNPFDLLIERDSDRSARPDLAFAAKVETTPVVGRCVVTRQREYGDRQRHSLALTLLDDLITRHQLPSIEIETDWPNARGLLIPNSTNALSASLRRVDVLLTNRLHGLVYALHNGVPTIAVDPVAGGGKLTTQARTLNWPMCFPADQVRPSVLDEALAWCLTDEARTAAAAAGMAAEAAASDLEREIAPALAIGANGPGQG